MSGYDHSNLELEHAVTWTEDHGVPEHDIIGAWATRDSAWGVAGQPLEVTNEATTTVC
jgi:hypothetical protein